MTRSAMQSTNTQAPAATDEYVYFVAYMCEGTTPGIAHHGNNSVSRSGPITSHEDIVGIQKELLGLMPHAKKVVILNFVLLNRQLRQVEEGAVPTAPSHPGLVNAPDSDGPFTIMEGESALLYSRLHSFSEACALAERQATESDAGPCYVLDANGKKVAGYVRPDERVIVYEAGLYKPLTEVSDVFKYVVENQVSTWNPGSRKEVVELLEELANETAAVLLSAAVVGIREFEIAADYRILDLNPPFQVVFHQFKENFVVAENLPADIREALQSLIE